MADPLCLYSLTLQHASAVTAVAQGCFRGHSAPSDGEAASTASDELVVVRHGSGTGSVLSHWVVDARVGLLSRVRNVEGARGEPVATSTGWPDDRPAFATVLGVHRIRRPSWPRDLLLLVSDSGCLCLLEWSAEGAWRRRRRVVRREDSSDQEEEEEEEAGESEADGEAENVDEHHLPPTATRSLFHQAGFRCVDAQVYGKEGTRRSVPGVHLAVDAYGRACLLAALDGTAYAFVIEEAGAEDDGNEQGTPSDSDDGDAGTRSANDEEHTARGRKRPRRPGRRVDRRRPTPNRMPQCALSSPLPISRRHRRHALTVACVDVAAVTTTPHQPPGFACLEHACAVRERPATAHRPNGATTTLAAADHDTGHRLLAFYQVDVSLRAVRAVAETVIDADAYRLVAVPNSDGVYVLHRSGRIVRYQVDWGAASDHSTGCPVTRTGAARLPGAWNAPGTPVTTPAVASTEPSAALVVATDAFTSAALSFVLLATESGDLWALREYRDAAGRPHLSLRHVDSVPLTPAVLAVFPGGYVWVGAAHGDHQLYQFTSLAFAEPAATVDNDDDDDDDDEVVVVVDVHRGRAPVTAATAGRHLELADTVAAMQPVAAMLMDDRDDGLQEVLALAGRDCGPDTASTTAFLASLVPGCAVLEIAQTTLDFKARRVFAIRGAAAAAVDTAADDHIVLSASHLTRVLRIRHDDVREVSESGLEAQATSLLVANMGTAQHTVVVQVHSDGVRLLPHGLGASSTAIECFTAPPTVSVVAADSTERHLLLVLSNGRTVCLGLREASATTTTSKRPEASAVTLVEMGNGGSDAIVASGSAHRRIKSSSTTTTTTTAAVEVSAVRHPATPPDVAFVAALERPADDAADVLRVLHWPPGASPNLLGSVALPDVATSVAAWVTSTGALAVCVGLQHGRLLTVQWDVAAHVHPLPRVHTRRLGTAAVQVQRVRCGSSLAADAHAVAVYDDAGRQSWLLRDAGAGQLLLAPLLCAPLQQVATLRLPQGTRWSTGAEEAVAVFPATCAMVCLTEQGRSLRILAVPDAVSAAERWTVHRRVPLRYTPRYLVRLGDTGWFGVASCGWDASRRTWRSRVSLVNGRRGDDEDVDDEQAAGGEQAAVEWESTRVTALASVCDHRDASVLYLVAAVCCGETGDMRKSDHHRVSDATTSAESRAGALSALGGPVPASASPALRSLRQPKSTASDAEATPPPTPPSCALWTLRVQRDAHGRATGQQLLHRTPVDGAVGCMQVWRMSDAASPPLLLAGVQAHLWVYALREHGWMPVTHAAQPVPTRIVALDAHEASARVFVGDAQHSVFLYRYDAAASRLLLVAEDTLPRRLLTLHCLDADTVACSDALGTLTVLRLPEASSAAIEADPSGGWLSDAYAAHPVEAARFVRRFRVECHWRVGGPVVMLQRWRLRREERASAGDPEALVYATVSGGMGALTPLRSAREWQVLSALQREMQRVLYVDDAWRWLNPGSGRRRHLHFRSLLLPPRHVVDGDLCEGFRCLPVEVQRQVARRALQLEASGDEKEVEEGERARRAVLLRLEEMRWRVGC
ncbi:hypothetical protein CDCA_CDCA03G0921 [Cyanidium caldarium]|uniref:DNA damage-binding protein 1 n=1 Tax=Cyanidium caldarium TaxID=2771 RepID=A0AAV9IS47_CYACA|nr:hypothetical protein CDCA_CDCA03G0921 [Cyanidium caldarium]